jgi:chemotaxis protein methyltransferase CheR
MRWPGFRKVRKQVCKRVQKRIAALGIDGVDAYRHHLAQHADEWHSLDVLTRVTISRFRRDWQVFEFVADEVLPVLARQALERGDDSLAVWSVGGGSGEEPYTLALIWRMQMQAQFPGLRLRIVATDADPGQCQRGKQACYPFSSIKGLPDQWREQAFVRRGDQFCLDAVYRELVEFRVQDVREALPTERFDLVLCRNLVFTYFDDMLQRETLAHMPATITRGGALVIGVHEHLPASGSGLRPWSEHLGVFRVNVVTD